MITVFQTVKCDRSSYPWTNEGECVYLQRETDTSTIFDYLITTTLYIYIIKNKKL